MKEWLNQNYIDQRGGKWIINPLTNIIPCKLWLYNGYLNDIYRKLSITEIYYIIDGELLMSEKFTLHNERRISEINQRLKDSKLRYKRKYRTWNIDLKGNDKFG